MITTQHYPLNEWTIYTYPPPKGTKFQYLTTRGVLEIGSYEVNWYDPLNFTRPLAICVLSYPPKEKVKKEVKLWVAKANLTREIEPRSNMCMAYRSLEAGSVFGCEMVELTGYIEVEE